MITTLTLREWLAKNPEVERCDICNDSGLDWCNCDFGRQWCEHCDGGDPECDLCDGRGWYTCKTCSATGKVTCVCEGRAKKAYRDALERETEKYQEWMARIGR